jgi:hypothetical protein
MSDLCAALITPSTGSLALSGHAIVQWQHGQRQVIWPQHPYTICLVRSNASATSIFCPSPLLEYLPYLMLDTALRLASPQYSMRIFRTLKIE